ncbi:unnamed protein product [Protopolystoma xenopodis]|uniref:Helix-turn-helix domain-containing protein n=1 Tax=Protopolystoma xenopodis TaxID=117903 RepID=A0A3S5B0X9_9PLAT|nr:unnamed protein product [Protopolystoma xenopodis]
MFTKKSYSGIILNFRSHHNYRLKIGIMSSMIRLTDADLWDEELDKLTRNFLGNGYPNEVIQRNIRAVKSRWQNGDYERTWSGVVTSTRYSSRWGVDEAYAKSILDEILGGWVDNFAVVPSFSLPGLLTAYFRTQPISRSGLTEGPDKRVHCSMTMATCPQTALDTRGTEAQCHV